jgi:transposase-like protein
MSNLNAPHFQNTDKAREYLEAQVWPNGRVCPHCGSVGEHYELKGKTNRAGLYKCADCREPFTVTVGTVFERSKIGLHIWLQAVYLINSSKKGISAKQLERMLGVTYKTAWFMSHRIREAMHMGYTGPLGGNGSPVEVDETYWGTAEGKTKGVAGYGHKMKVVTLVERNGHKRSFHVANVNAATLRPILKSQIAAKARLMTDEATVYKKIGEEFAEHGVVHHAIKEYKRGDAYTNTAESSFAILKRGLYGTFHNVSENHLQRYADEFDFRWNHRQALGIDDIQRTNEALKGIRNKRLTYRPTQET